MPKLGYRLVDRHEDPSCLSHGQDAFTRITDDLWELEDLQEDLSSTSPNLLGDSCAPRDSTVGRISRV